MLNENITDALQANAILRPNHPAVVYRSLVKPAVRWNYQQLNDLCSTYASGLSQAGIAKGDRVLILARPDGNFIPLMLGLLRAGGVIVMVDPGRPLQEFLGCIRDAEPTVLLAPPLVQAAALIPNVFHTLKKRIIPTGWYPGAIEAVRLRSTPVVENYLPNTTGQSEAAVIFTTGSTGIPKGVVYSHAILRSQYEALQGTLQLSKDEIGLFGFSAMMLIGLMAGVTVVVADSLNTSPNQVELSAFTQLLLNERATLTFASPALCRRLAAYCRRENINFPHLRRLIVGGAPVEAQLIDALQAVLPGGDVVVSLGSTEVMPIAMISSRLAGEKSGAMRCERSGSAIGYPAAGHELRIIRISDEAIPQWNESLLLPFGATGEIVIRGPAVTGAYLHQPLQTVLAKIDDPGGTWHRTGDLGSLDEAGCLWLYGRKSQRVETERDILFTLPCEGVFSRHPEVARAALVGLGKRGNQTPVMVIETKPGRRPKTTPQKKLLVDELVRLAQAQPDTKTIHHFAFYPGVFPVDIRHNSKILREKLLHWVERNPGQVLG